MSKQALLDALEVIRKGLVELLVYGKEMDDFARRNIVSTLIDQIGNIILSVRNYG